jgi:hypothetical protein
MFCVCVKLGFIAAGEEYICSLFGNRVLKYTLERSREEVTRGCIRSFKIKWRRIRTERLGSIWPLLFYLLTSTFLSNG